LVFTTSAVGNVKEFTQSTCKHKRVLAKSTAVSTKFPTRFTQVRYPDELHSRQSQDEAGGTFQLYPKQKGTP
jgi:hypothetical protein